MDDDKLLIDIACLVVRLRQILATTDKSLLSSIWYRIITCDLPRLMAYEDIGSVVLEAEDL